MNSLKNLVNELTTVKNRQIEIELMVYVAQKQRRVIGLNRLTGNPVTLFSVLKKIQYYINI